MVRDQMNARFILVRHGSPDWNLADQRRLRGGTRDWVPLSPQGVEEVRQAAERLRGEMNAGLIVASPMTRALHTAAILSRALDLPFEVEYDLHEWLPHLNQDFDSFDFVLKAAAEMDSRGGEWPSGESRCWEPLSSVRRRVLAVLRRYQREQAVIVVCHGVVISGLTGEQLLTGGYTSFELEPGGDQHDGATTGQ